MVIVYADDGRPMIARVPLSGYPLVASDVCDDNPPIEKVVAMRLDGVSVWEEPMGVQCKSCGGSGWRVWPGYGEPPERELCEDCVGCGHVHKLDGNL